MKKTKLAFSIQISTLLLVIGIMSLIGSCGGPERRPQSASGEGAQDGSVVQTEWKSEQSNALSVETKSSKDRPSGSNPLAFEPDADQPIADRYVVQIGAFLNRENADRLVNRLELKGLPASLVVSERGTKRWHIVRIGDFQGRKEAIKAASRYTSQENRESAVLYNGKVVKLVKSNGMALSGQEPDRSMARSSSKYDRFTFQVGGLMTKDDAKKQSTKLRKIGYKPAIVAVPDSINKDTWYAVRIGRYDNIDEAADAAADFAAKEDIPTRAQPFMK